MFLALAQASDKHTQLIVPRLFDRMDTLAHPDKLIPALQQTGWVIAAIFIAVGLTCLLQGYKLYKGVVIMIAAVLGVVIGYKLGQSIQAEFIVAGCLGVLLAVVAWPLMKYGVAIFGGLAGAFLGANAWTAMADLVNKTGSTLVLPPNAYWAGALIGLILFGMLSFILFELSIVVFTSVSGSVLAVLGILALLLQVPSWQSSISSSIASNPMIIPMLVLVPAVAGLVMQSRFGGMKKGPKPAKA
jgi:MFS family permease